MRTKPIIAGAVIIAILLSIVFITARPSLPSITVRHIKSVRSGDWVVATFEITNQTDQNYLLIPVWVKARNGLAWPLTDHFSIPILGPYRSVTATFNMTNLPAGSPVRLRLDAIKELAGLERFFMRFDLRFRQGQRNVSLNPLDKSVRVFSSKQAVILSDEFVEPEPK